MLVYSFVRPLLVSMKEKLWAMLFTQLDLLMFFCYTILEVHEEGTSGMRQKFGPCITFFLELRHMLCFFIQKLYRMSSTFDMYRLPYLYLFCFKGGIQAYSAHLDGLVRLVAFETMVCTVSGTESMHEKGIVNSKRMPRKRKGDS